MDTRGILSHRSHSGPLGYGRGGCGLGGSFGRNTEGISPGLRVGAAAVISFVVVSGLLLLAFAPGAWWLVTIYGWVVFPAFGLLGSGGRDEKGVSGRVAGGSGRALRERGSISGERELLEAIGRNVSLTPARAAMETSLSVAGAERMLRELAEGGYLEVRVRDGGIFYSMWDDGEREPR